MNAAALSGLHRLPLLLAAILAAGFATGVRAEDFVRTFTVQGRPNVHVKADDGNVRIVTTNASTVEFRVRYKGYTLEKNLHLDVNQQGDDVELIERIHSGLTVGISPKSVEIDVSLPRDADLRVETGDGQINVAALHGKVSLHTGDGGVRGHDLDGEYQIVSGDGSIDIDGRFDSLDMTSGDGPVSARVASGSNMSGTWNVRTGDGSVKLALPRDFKADLDASTGDGRISVDLPVSVQGKMSSSRVRGPMNGGGPLLSIRTGDGSIQLETT